jgi:hypothetical protein
MENHKWRQAIVDEKQSLMKNKTWELRNPEEANGKTLISSRWIFTIKPDGRYRARLVARGFEQKRSDFGHQEIFSPVVDTTNLRIILSMAASNNLHLHTFDVKTAFLNGTIEEDIFLQMPEGFDDQDKVCKLNKALYGLRQAPQRWYKRFSTFLRGLGLVQLKSDRCIYRSQDTKLILAIHVDDGIIVSTEEKIIRDLIEPLKTEFEI